MTSDVVLLGTPTGSAVPPVSCSRSSTPSVRYGRTEPWPTRCTAGFVASQTEHGRQETTLLSLYTNVMHWGGIIVAPGYTDDLKFADGNPYGASKVTGETTELQGPDLDAIDHLVVRALTVADKLAAGPV